MDVSTHTAFQLRLQWLEAILDNPQPTVRQSPLVPMDASRSRSEIKADRVDGEDGEDQHKRDVTQRTGDLAQQVRNALLETGHESLRRLIDEYASLSGILFPYDPLSATETSIQPSTANPRKEAAPRPPVVKASDLIPSETRVELVLGAEDDIKDVDRMLREIQVLVERGADGSGELASYEPLQERLQALLKTHSARMVSQRKLQERVIDTLGRYNDYILMTGENAAGHVNVKNVR
ncbi:hypothetical protein QFC20_001511 [Naganishia adeliensis]|uniref:Uncharacterized protein n=1 Tax=Naganishia adeliensis TaxID=92952 RepID=A0ACC2WRG2_9TREE|nr:hypothetical protein QFC20_001511 [Naganishia adeliensis]